MEAMARAVLSQPLSLPSPYPLSSLSASTRSYCYFTAVTTRIRPASAAGRIIASAKGKDEMNDGDADSTGFNPFGFVTDNPSSRSAIQLPESPAEDGNVGQMLYIQNYKHRIPSYIEYRIEDKGKEYGSYVKSGKLRWFVRETGSAKSRRGTIVFLHGAPTQSYSYRVVMSELAAFGFHCFAPDWIGFGFSDKPQPGYGFNYTVYVKFASTQRKSTTRHSTNYLMCSGFLVGSYGLTWALKNQSRISKISILNSPLTVSSPVPGLFQQLRIPLFGEFTCQNAVMAERFIEAGSAYVLKLEKADVYRLPYLSSGGPGFALLEATRKANFNDILSRITAGFASERWDKPSLVLWGLSDKYLPQSIAEEFQKQNSTTIQLKLIEGAGHMPQEDWPEKVIEALRSFF
uniref:AB hydrolase-1 domain-containing protein n=1 Tax=Cucumis melo TaxID=3656 RepID=A0A9I9DT91_CUCME